MLLDYILKKLYDSPSFRENNEVWKSIFENNLSNTIEFHEFNSKHQFKSMDEFKTFFKTNKINIKISINDQILKKLIYDNKSLETITYSKISKLKKLTDKEKIALFYFTQKNYELYLHMIYDKDPKFQLYKNGMDYPNYTNFSLLTDINIYDDFNIISFNYIRFSSFRSLHNNINIEANFENERFRLRLTMIIVFELSHHCYSLATLPYLSQDSYLHPGIEITHFDRFLSIKILSQILIILDNNNIGNIHKKILSSYSYLPNLDDARQLYNIGTTLTKELMYQFPIPNFCKKGSKLINFDKNSLFKQPRYNQTLLWHSDIISEFYNNKSITNKRTYITFYTTSYKRRCLFVSHICAIEMDSETPLTSFRQKQLDKLIEFYK